MVTSYNEKYILQNVSRLHAFSQLKTEKTTFRLFFEITHERFYRILLKYLVKIKFDVCELQNFFLLIREN